MFPGAPAKPIPKLDNWILIMNGIHQFCGVQLYTTAWGTKEGGWCGLLLLFLYFAFTLGSCHYIGSVITDIPAITTYRELGGVAYGVGGAFFVMASSVESSMISKDVLAHVYTAHFTILGSTMMHYHVISYIMCVAILVLVWLVPDLKKCDRWLTGAGVVMNIVVVCCLCWLTLFNSVEVESSTQLVRFSNWPISSGFFALCFSAHPWLPELYHSLENRNQYPRVVYWIFGSTLFLYLAAAIAGYGKFGEKVDSIFVLSMPKEFYATQIAAHVTVAHQLIRYIFGIYGVAQALEQEKKTDNGALVTGHMPAIVRSVLVIVTIPLTLSIKFYGPTMALFGSVLGIMVALIIPYFFITTIKMKTKGMNRFQIAGSHIIVIMAVASLISGMVGSIKDMINDE